MPLQTIELLVRERELRGYGVLKELIEIFTRVTERPGRHPVVMFGPETLYISRSECAIAFLLEHGYGYHQKSPDVILHLQHIPDEDSVDWEMQRRQHAQAIAMLNWAVQCNSKQLTLRLYKLGMFEPFTAPFYIDVTVEWEDELGATQSQKLSSERVYSNDNFQKTETSLCIYSDVVEVHPTQCDTKCRIAVRIYRQRVLKDKHKGIVTLEYDNQGQLRTHIDVHDASRPKALPIGQLGIEIDSLAHRCVDIEAEPPVAVGDVVVAAAAAASGAEVAEQPVAKAYVAESEAAPRDDGVKYDEDDYF